MSSDLGGGVAVDSVGGDDDGGVCVESESSAITKVFPVGELGGEDNTHEC